MKKIILINLVTLAVGLWLGVVFFGDTAPERASSQEISPTAHSSHAEEWTCSMHPQIRRDKPGDCPICGMDLVRVSSMHTAENHSEPSITISDEALKLSEVRTMEVTKQTPQKVVQLQGKVIADERRVSDLTARYGGRIEELFINFTGQRVKKGEKLATIYSPDLITAQEEFLEAATDKENTIAFYQATREKLKGWDLTEKQINQIEEKGVPQIYFDILSPIAGTVIQKNVALGHYVTEGAALFTITDLSQVWVMFDAYEEDLAWIRKGSSVSYTVRAVPGKTFSGHVTYIDPFINEKMRTARVRLEASNVARLLKPGMFASGRVKAKPSRTNVITIPRSAVLWTGKRSVVYVKVPSSKKTSFQKREVVLGEHTDMYYTVVEGLKEGEIIAVNGVFRIDAAAQIKGEVSMMSSPKK